MATKRRKFYWDGAAVDFRGPIGALRRSFARWFALLLWGNLGWSGLAAAEPSSDSMEFFEAKIRPILVEHCYKCHSAESGKSKGSLMLDSRDALLKGGEAGPVIVAHDPEKSLLIEAVRYTDEDLQMPPKDEGGKLSPEKIAALEAWVKMGAPDPRIAAPKPAAMEMTKARQHWAFQPVIKSP